MQKYFKYIAVSIPILVFLTINQGTLPYYFSLLLGIICLPFILNIDRSQKSNRFLLPAVCTGLILLFIKTNGFYYFFTLFILFLILEKYWGKINLLTILLAVILSPIISNIIHLWSFPIRLKLSEIAAKSLQLAQFNVEAKGNLIITNGNTFSVDPACIGLNLVSVSLAIGLIILAFFEKKKGIRFSFRQLILFMLIIFLGAITANYIRLITLIIFRIQADHFLHDFAGILSMLIYTILPFYFLIKFHAAKKERQNKEKKEIPPIKSNQARRSSGALLVGLLGLHILLGLQFLNPPPSKTTLFATINPPGFKKSIDNHGVLKLQNDQTLIYIKPPVSFYQGSHDPRFCWQGSGYTFSAIEIKKRNQQQVYTAILKKGEDKFYTAWWYQNNDERIISDRQWRWETLLHNKQFYLVNVSTLSKTALYDIIDNQLNQITL